MAPARPAEGSRLQETTQSFGDLVASEPTGFGQIDIGSSMARIENQNSEVEAKDAFAQWQYKEGNRLNVSSSLHTASSRPSNGKTPEAPGHLPLCPTGPHRIGHLDRKTPRHCPGVLGCILS